MSAGSGYDVVGQNYIYVLLPDGQQAVYEEARVQGLLESRVLNLETQFWKEGMSQWLPLRELPSLQASVAKPVVAPKDLIPSQEEMQDALDEPLLLEQWDIARQYEIEINPFPVTLITQFLFLVPIAATTLFLGVLVAKLTGWSTPSMQDFYMLNGLLLPLWGTHLAAQISFLVWVYIASMNSGALGRNTTYTPGWSVAAFLIPVMNFFRPYQVMQEIWKVAINPNFWRGFGESFFVGIWFFFRLSICVLAVGPFRTSFSDSDVRAVRALGSLIYPATLQANLLLIDLTTFVLITVVVRRQLKWVRRSRQLEEGGGQLDQEP